MSTAAAPVAPTVVAEVLLLREAPDHWEVSLGDRVFHPVVRLPRSGPAPVPLDGPPGWCGWVRAELTPDAARRLGVSGEASSGD